MFSILTIVFNDKQHILETITSVVSQTNKNIEYILIDGNSIDGTKEVILDYLHTNASITKSEINKDKIYIEANSVQFPTLSFKFLSQNDKGIYDAMNKGIALASKEWINFMNCGDTFYNSQVLEHIANLNKDSYDVIYGNTETKGKTKQIAIPKKLKYRMSFCHQSAFVRANLHKNVPFNLTYQICADNDFFMRLYHSNYRFYHCHLTIASFSLDGISSKLSWTMFIEDCKIGYRYNKFFPFYLAIKYLFWTIPKKALKILCEKL